MVVDKAAGLSMKRFVEGEDRRQGVLLPEYLDDWVSEENPVRAVDVFVDELDLAGLGFEGVTPAGTGRPGYHPSVLLKLYVYGYMNQVSSSRRLQREAGRNVELMWLTGRLAPDFKTIADFRRDNGEAIRATCSRFVDVCRSLRLFTHAVAAIDGSKFKAVNTRDKNYTPAKLKARVEQVQASIERYMAALDTADRQECEPAREKAGRLTEKIAALRRQMATFRALEPVLDAAPDRQLSFSDPDARSMATSGRGSGMVGYNVQAAVDAEHHLILAHEVTNIGHDRSQLSAMGSKARTAAGCDRLEVLADRGYFDGEEILACEAVGVEPFVPRPLTSSAKADGRFGKQDFTYLPDENVYLCPARQKLPWRMTTMESGLNVHRYWDQASCRACALKPKCTPSKERRIRRWEHEAVIDAMQVRLERRPDAMRVRRATVEHVFGTLKAAMGATHFKTRTLPRVRTEMSLHVLAYNLKRVIAMLGVQPLIQAVQA